MSAAARAVESRFSLELVDRTELVLSLAVSADQPLFDELLEVTLDGSALDPAELLDAHGTRLHHAIAGPGLLEVRYRARVGRASPRAVEPLDAVHYLRPSRYVEADTLTSVARGEFAGLAGHALVVAVGEWVHARLRYEPRGEAWRGGAEATLEAGRGVCRDFAHLTTAILRALDVPARLVSVYAPGLTPPDFHAVVEALVDERWLLVDATRLAPRADMVRIATGRDAADTAFVTNTLADARLLTLQVTATSDAPAERDDPAVPVELS